MKTRILSILLCLCMMLSLLTACASERHDLLRTLDVGDRTFCVRGTGTRVKQIVVKQQDTILWSSSVKVEKKVGTRGGSYGFDAVDLNFDGYTDIMLAYDLQGECLFYRCWLYDAQSNTYVLSDALTGLANLQADAEKQCLFGFTNRITSTPAPSPEFSGITVNTDAATKYIWKDGELIPSIRVSITHYSETDTYCYSVAYYNEETKQLEEEPDMENWLTHDEYMDADLGFLYYFR